MGKTFLADKLKLHTKGDSMGKTKMTPNAARRIQSHADKSGKNQGFKTRAQKAAAKNEK